MLQPVPSYGMFRLRTVGEKCMHFRFWILALGVACLASPVQAQPRDADFPARLHRFAVQLELPGFSAAVVRDGKIVFRHHEGVADRGSGAPITPNALFGIA